MSGVQTLHNLIQEWLCTPAKIIFIEYGLEKTSSNKKGLNLVHCYCGCDSLGSIEDKKTGRFYCGDCWTVIQDAIKEKTDDEDVGVSEIEVDDLPNDNNYTTFNLPVEEYYDE